MLRDVNAEIVVLLGWGRAVLLQVAHPLVAAGVADHSDYAASVRHYLRRTRHTVGAMLRLTFGTPGEVRAAADRINAVHRRVHGRLREPTGTLPAGTPYDATDPELLRWVHATLVDSQLRAYELFVRPLEAGEQDRYCAEAAAMAPLLDMPVDHLPASVSEIRSYLETRYQDGTVAVGETARRLADALLYPPGGWLTAALLAPGRLVTIGMLPPAVRQGYGLAWDATRERRLRGLASVIRRTRGMLPAFAREWPAARRLRSRPLRTGCPVP